MKAKLNRFIHSASHNCLKYTSNLVIVDIDITASRTGNCQLWHNWIQSNWYQPGLEDWVLSVECDLLHNFRSGSNNSFESIHANMTSRDFKVKSRLQQSPKNAFYRLILFEIKSFFAIKYKHTVNIKILL